MEAEDLAAEQAQVLVQALVQVQVLVQALVLARAAEELAEVELVRAERERRENG